MPASGGHCPVPVESVVCRSETAAGTERDASCVAKLVLELV